MAPGVRCSESLVVSFTVKRVAAVGLLLSFLTGCVDQVADSKSSAPASAGSSLTGLTGLAGLAVSVRELDQSFQTDLTAYTMSVGFLADTIQVTPTSVAAGASVTVEGKAVASGTASAPIALTEGGATTITVQVTEPDTAAVTNYTLTVTRQASATFAQQAYIKALYGPTNLSDQFSEALALSGNTLAIGIPREDNGATDSGAVYVYVREGGVWRLQAYLQAPDADIEAAAGGDEFGLSVALDGDILAVGSLYEDSNVTGVTNAADFPANWSDTSVLQSGAVYVYRRSGGAWDLEAFIKSPSADPDDNFGMAVAVSGDRLAVGCPFEDSGVASNPADNSLADSGAVYTYVRQGGSWQYEAYLKSPSLGGGDYFGLSVALDGDTLAVAVPEEDGSVGGINPVPDEAAMNSGAVYLFSHNGSGWGTPTYVKPDTPEAFSRFAASVDLFEDTLAVGTPWKDNGGIPNSGGVYLFARTAGVWSQQAYVTANVIGAGDQFGDQVALGRGVLAVTAHLEDSNANTVNGDDTNNALIDSGAAYLFLATGGSWTQDKFVKVTNPGYYDELGRNRREVWVGGGGGRVVDVDGGVLVLGVYQEDGAGTGVNPTPNDGILNAGAVYVFE